MSHTEDVTAGTSGSKGSLLPCAVTPENKPKVKECEAKVDEYEETRSGLVRPLVPVTSTPVKASPSSKAASKRRSHSTPKGTSKKSRRSLNLSDTINMPNDSGSDDDNERTLELEDSADEEDVVDFMNMRHQTRLLRDHIVQGHDDGGVLCDSQFEKVNVNDSMNETISDEQGEWTLIGIEECADLVNEGISNANMVNESHANESERGEWTSIAAAPAPVDTNFCWSEDFSSFTGRKETYTRVPGPTFSSHDPTDIFLKIWDYEFMEMVVKETNLYAWEIISQHFNPDKGTGIPKYLEDWTNVTVEELYRYFAILILLALCHRSRITDYWDRGVMGMREFRELMSRNRFLSINRFLHFVCNEELGSRGQNRKIEKVAPVLDHCNRKFAELYTPSQHLSLDESLLLWKGRLSWKQCIRSKAARYGIKSFELCEAETGYLLQYRLYTGKSDEMHPESLHGFDNKTAKIVLDLMEGYLDVGHVLVMDNWYNKLALTRYLKTRRTDVLGTLNRRQIGVPAAIKDLIPNDMKRGSSVARHCGDIALVAWRDIKLVTAISSYHQHKMVLTKRAGQNFLKPVAIYEYNRYMGGVDLKDQKLSMYLMERTRNKKWYMKVFRRLVNTSLLNAFIIYTRNPMYRVSSHRDFRQRVAEELLRRFPRESPVPVRVLNTSLKSELCRLQPGCHFPVYTEGTGPGKRKQQKRCVRCSALKRRVFVTIMCKLCQAPLCIGKCWEDYHTLLDLNTEKNPPIIRP